MVNVLGTLTCENHGVFLAGVVMRAFPKEFRRDVVEIACNGCEPMRKTAEDFSISPQTLSTQTLWNQSRADEIESGTYGGVTRDRVQELRQSRRRHRLLAQDNEGLRRAAAFFGRREPAGVSA